MKKRVFFLFVTFILVVTVPAQNILKKQNFKDSNGKTIYIIRFDKDVSMNFLEQFATKNGYIMGDTSNLQFLEKKKLPIHCQVYVFKRKKVGGLEKLMSCRLETNGSPYGYSKTTAGYQYEEEYVYTKGLSSYQTEEEGIVEHYVCFRKR